MDVDVKLEETAHIVSKKIKEVNSFFEEGGLEQIYQELDNHGYSVVLIHSDTSKDVIRLRIDKRKNRERIMDHVSEIISDVVGDDDYSYHVGVYQTEDYFHIITRI